MGGSRRKIHREHPGETLSSHNCFLPTLFHLPISYCSTSLQQAGAPPICNNIHLHYQLPHFILITKKSQKTINPATVASSLKLSLPPSLFLFIFLSLFQHPHPFTTTTLEPPPSLNTARPQTTHRRPCCTGNPQRNYATMNRR